MTLLKLLQPPKPIVTTDQGPFPLWNEGVFVKQQSVYRSVVRHGSTICLRGGASLSSSSLARISSCAILFPSAGKGQALLTAYFNSVSVYPIRSNERALPYRSYRAHVFQYN